jgi:hypothetical protein
MTDGERNCMFIGAGIGVITTTIAFVVVAWLI